MKYKTSWFLILGSWLLGFPAIINAAPGDDCISEDAALSMRQAIAVVQALNLCGMDTNLLLQTKKDAEDFYYCDSTRFNVYTLSNKKNNDYFLIETTVRTGTEGYHNRIVKKDNTGYTVAVVFRGFLECISLTGYNYFNLQFSVITDDGKVTFLMAKHNDQYEFAGAKDITGKKITAKNKAAYLSKYNNPGFWKSLEEK